MKKALNVLGNILLVVLVVIGVLIGISLLPIKGNYKIYAVKSGSMQPTIKTGAVVLVRPADEYKEGDIVSFQDPSSTKKSDVITHRILKIEEKNGAKTFKTKGDANEGSDSASITQSAIIGKEFVNVSYLGYLLGYIKTLPGLVLIVIIPATIIIYEEVNKIKHETKQIIAKRREKRISKNSATPNKKGEK